MQSTTTMRMKHHHNGETFVIGLILLVVVAGGMTLGVNWYAQRSVEPAAAVPAARPANRLFADEIGYTPNVAEYTTATMSDSYLPIVAPAAAVPAARPANRFFADEIAGAQQVAALADQVEYTLSEPLVPGNGPQ